MQLTYKIELSPQKRNNSYQVQIDGYRYLEELWGELENKGIIERLKDIPQLGTIQVKKVFKKTRYDYVMLQMYLHQFIRMNINQKLKFSYNNFVGKDDLKLSADIKMEKCKPSLGDALQVFVLIYNMGHFYNTFSTSRAVIEACKNNKDLENSILSQFSAGEEQELAKAILDGGNYYRFHLLNSLLILHGCDSNKASVKLAYCLLKQYIRPELCNEKMSYIFSIFKDIRSVSYFIYDLPISQTPLYLDIRDEDALKVMLSEMLDQYNDRQPIHLLLNSISKILDDTIYNENSQGIVLYQISKKIGKEIGKIDWNTADYYSLFLDKESVFNIKYPHNHRFDKNNILKITFNAEENVESIALFEKLCKINYVKTGYYDRQPGKARTLLVSLSKTCVSYNDKVWYSFRVVKEVIRAMKKTEQIKDDDARYIAVVKFFLYYLLGEHPIQILPTVHDSVCLCVKRGSKARVKFVDDLLDLGQGKEDERHEVEFIKQYLCQDLKNDTAIILCGSLLLLDSNKTGKTLHEYDGLIIFPFRETEQVIFVEAKNTKNKPSFAQKCIKEKLDDTPIEYNMGNIVTLNHDCYYKHSISNLE